MLQLIFLYTTVNYTLLYLDVVLFHTRMSVVPMAPLHSTGSKKRKDIYKFARKQKLGFRPKSNISKDLYECQI